MIRKYLTRQYPYEENKWKIVLTISLFVAAFMVIFQPFGLSNYAGPDKTAILAGFGLVTMVILIFDLIVIPSLFPGTFREEKWTVIKELVFFVVILFTIGLGNLFYSSWLMGLQLNFSSVLIFQAFTIAVGIIPITALTLIKQSYLNRRNMESASQITSNLARREQSGMTGQELRISSDNGREEIIIPFSDLVYIKSEGNYITAGYFKNGKITKALIRNTMKYAEDLLAPYPPAFKCHRSWLINTDWIIRLTGNSQGLKLELAGCEEPVPVARNLATEFKRIMQEKSS